MSFENKPTMSLPAVIWWILWFSIIAGLALIYLFLRQPTPDPSAGPVSIMPYLITGLLFGSTALRWLVLPRITTRLQALPLFIIGLALAEGSGVLAIFLLQENRDSFVALAFLGLAQYAPVFVTKFKA